MVDFSDVPSEGKVPPEHPLSLTHICWLFLHEGMYMLIKLSYIHGLKQPLGAQV